MHKSIIKWVFTLLLVGILGVYGFTFVVREGEGAIVTQFGEIVDSIEDAGIYMKWPWPFQKVIPVDLRVQILDSGYTETLTHDKRNIILQTYMIWEIDDLPLFYKRIGDMTQAQNYLNDLLANAKNGVMGNYSLSALVSTDATQIKNKEIESDLLQAISKSAEENYGIRVFNVSVKRLALPGENVESVYEQMRTERQKHVTMLISEGERDAGIILSNANAETTKIIADAQTQAAQIDADTEAQVAQIYADAYKKNPELFVILQQLETLENSVSDKTTMVINTSESPFGVLEKKDDEKNEQEILP